MSSPKAAIDFASPAHMSKMRDAMVHDDRQTTDETGIGYVLGLEDAPVVCAPLRFNREGLPNCGSEYSQRRGAGRVAFRQHIHAPCLKPAMVQTQYVCEQSRRHAMQVNTVKPGYAGPASLHASFVGVMVRLFEGDRLQPIAIVSGDKLRERPERRYCRSSDCCNELARSHDLREAALRARQLARVLRAEALISTENSDPCRTR
jgi:hypothetical protein